VEGEPQEIPIVAVKAEEDVFERNRGFLETLQLFDKKILLVGCGSVGSTIASELARAGVGHFILADPDILEPANVSRHQRACIIWEGRR
jgi:molybdopterin/thiamine biosynthesis adenylyltransferase